MFPASLPDSPPVDPDGNTKQLSLIGNKETVRSMRSPRDMREERLLVTESSIAKDLWKSADVETPRL